VTGGNAGIGYETTLHLALHGAKVYLAARSESKATAAIEKIKAINSNAQVEFLPMDLAHLQSVREAAGQILHVEKVIDILVCNAGVITSETKLTDDGIEIDFQVNYLGIKVFRII
jgi:NAD(P)-dependent dehydrogenase (short-subunit alcohol dehydrogenase family)